MMAAMMMRMFTMWIIQKIVVFHDNFDNHDNGDDDDDDDAESPSGGLMAGFI